MPIKNSRKSAALIFVSFLSTSLYAQFDYSISKISPEIKQRMIKGLSYKENCPVPLKDLRYLNITYLDFNKENKIGELIVHKDISEETVLIFKELYFIKYPIYKMQLVSDFKANDFDSIEANNTSAFNCRKVANTSRWSKHAYAKALDINPIQNPYVSRKGFISHKDSLKYEKRVHKNQIDLKDKAILLKTDTAVKIFKKYDWKWGGDWKTIKDYQHFEKRK